MIVRLLPSQVSGFWSLIKAGVVDYGARYFPGDWNLANNIFRRCLAGLVQVWLCSDVEREKTLFKGFILTEIIKDGLDGERTLSLLTVYALRQPSQELLAEGRGVLEKYAQTSDCTKITLVTPAGHREKLVEELWPKHKKYTLFSIAVGGGK